MGAVHVRTPKNFVLEERLERYADAIETNPESYAGNWREACAPAGGGRVLVSGGHIYKCGSILLHSHVELHLEHGSRLKASENKEDFL